LIIEDDSELARRLQEAIAAAGFAVHRAANGVDGCSMGQSTDYDVVLLDLGLPRMSGIEILRRWRSVGRKMPVLVLSARGTWSERVEGLNAGADDYLGKPFHMPEVIARLRALVRRHAEETSTILRHGNIELDVRARTLSVNGGSQELTAQELKVLSYLMARIGRIVSQAELASHLYERDDAPDSNTVEVVVARLRKKIGRDSIRTVRGLGYRMG
jgi:two-component system, OmpR family, response regulator